MTAGSCRLNNNVPTAAVAPAVMRRLQVDRAGRSSDQAVLFECGASSKSPPGQLVVIIRQVVYTCLLLKSATHLNSL